MTLTSPLRARDLDTAAHRGRIITVHAWQQHTVTGRFITTSVDCDGQHVKRITLDLEIDLAPSLTAHCSLPVTLDYPVELHDEANA